MAAENVLRYIKLDYQAHKDALLQRVRSRWPRVWNDFLNSSFGTVLVDLVAWSTATLAFAINRAAAEQYIPTMVLRESAVRLGALVNYRLRSPQPATVACEAAIATPQSANVVIARGTQLRTADADALPFEVAADYTIEAGSLTPRTTIVEINASVAGINVLATFVTVVNGDVNVDLADTTIDLTDYVQAGQTFQVDGDSETYLISGVESAPGAVSNNRLVLATPYQGVTQSGVAAEVFDLRITVIQGETVTEQFVSPEGEQAAYSVKLSQTPVIDGSVTVLVNGVPWTEVASLASASADDQVFQVRVYANGVTVIVFGDNFFGAVIPSEADISVTYRYGGGLDGNVELNAFATSIAGVIASTDSPVTVTITNQTASGIGGMDAETLEQARIAIPYYARTNDRAVTLDDYQTLASRFSSPDYGAVAFARASVRTENALLEGNIVVIYAWTTTAGGALTALSPQLKVALTDYMQTRALGTDLVLVLDGNDVPVPVSLRFRVFSGFSVNDTAQLIDDTIRAQIAALRPGDPVLFSNLVRALDEVFGVDTVVLATPLQNLYPGTPTELFTAPQPGFVYAIDRSGVGTPITVTEGQISLYIAQLPVFPLQAWSFRLFLGTNELVVVPGTDAGFAELYGDNVADTGDEVDASTASFDPEPTLGYKSTVNFLTGQVRLWLIGAPGDLTMKLIPITGYSTERRINVYVGYTGVNSQAKRQEIRSALRAWSDGLPVAGSIYGSEVSGITVSKSNITAVVANVAGVTAVTRVALDTPGNTEARVNATDFELLRLGDISLNNNLD